MSAKIKLSQVIDRPVEDVFQFVAVDHVRNHPRWDPKIHLEQISNGAIGVGTILKRTNSHSGTPIEGTMEVVEFEPNRSMSTINLDGSFETRGRAIFKDTGDEKTVLMFDVEFPGLDESADMSLRINAIQRSLKNIKKLIESEVPG